jgi:uncharacterized protein
MTVEVTPLGVACNLACTYCYQHPMRDGGNVGASYDLEAMTTALAAIGSDFTIFGGEALLTPIDALEVLWRFGFERFGKNAVQTNGALITPAHVALFKRYAVHVGFSLDGPEELNDSRWAGSLEKTREATAASQAALEQLLAEGIEASLITTLHRMNAGTPALRERLQAWLSELSARGLRHARLHALEVDHPSVRTKLGMSNTQKIEAFLDFAAFEATMGGQLRFDIFADIDKALRGGHNGVTCVWSSCDPYTTPAVQGVDGHGNASNCGRTNKDGVAWLKADTRGHQRQLALYETPREHGGCKDCRFFMMCNGQCPGTALDGDWRNRSEDCEVYLALFQHQERQLLDTGVVPLSLAVNRRELERQFLDSLGGVLGGGQHGDHSDHGDSDHGDHTDASPQPHTHGDHEDHGDSPHGDHTDMAIADGRIELGVVPVLAVRA